MTPERTYEEFLASKQITAASAGFEPHHLHPAMFEYQRDVTRWACRRGKAALFLDCGLGKTFAQVEWAREVARETGGAVLILAPLAVSEQTKAEAARFHIEVNLCASMDDVKLGINITNYEKLHKFTPDFSGIVLDESSILKSFDGATRKAIVEFSLTIPYRLACTATPSPNDFTELGNHAEFLGIMSMNEMLATFFVHDGGDTSKWRLKGHAETAFWKWLASWAICMRHPSDLGYSDDGFVLPPLEFHEHIIDCGPADGFLFPLEAKSLQDRRNARRSSIESRVAECAAEVNGSTDQWLIWCGLNDESTALKRAIPTAVEVRGSDKEDHRSRAMLGFLTGECQNLVSKASICGWGMNYQHCNHMAFVGMSDSYEEFYQAVRREWRFGQSKTVHVHIFLAETELAVLRNVKRKQAIADKMAEGMIEHMKDFNKRDLACAAERDREGYREAEDHGKLWDAYLGDSCKRLAEIPDSSIHYSIYSPPFQSLYVYSNSERDMGNSKGWGEFAEHYKFLVADLYRILKPGRLLSFHCMLLPTSKQFHGYIGLHDFRGDLIRLHQEAGFIFHSEVAIRKDPVTAMQRTKALGLLHKQLVKDSTMSRQAVLDYLVTMRKPGENDEPVEGMLDYYTGDMSNEEFAQWLRVKYAEQAEFTDRPMDFETFKSIQIWQRYAEGVWMDINPSNTLQRDSAREERDERHIAPLQLQVIERALQLWTLPGETILTPFGGIGSEAYVAVTMDRKALLFELKESYFNQAVLNLKRAEEETGKQAELFAVVPDPVPHIPEVFHGDGDPVDADWFEELA